MDVLLMTLLMIVGLFMMLVVLIQRGRGGGLAGAFGGAGGSSAFGTKAGDVFTKITVVVAVIWFALAGFAGIALRNRDSAYQGGSQAVADEDTESDKAGDTPPTKAATDDAAAKTDGDAGGLPDLKLDSLPEDPDPAAAPALPGLPTPGDAEKTGADAEGGDADAAGDDANAGGDEAAGDGAAEANGDGDADGSDEKSDDDN